MPGLVSFLIRWFYSLLFHYEKIYQRRQIPKAAPLAGFGFLNDQAPRGQMRRGIGWLMPQAQYVHLITQVSTELVQWVLFSYLILYSAPNHTWFMLDKSPHRLIRRLQTNCFSPQRREERQVFLCGHKLRL